MQRSQFARLKILLLQEDDNAASIGADRLEFGISVANKNTGNKNSRVVSEDVLMRELEVENSQLRRIATDLSLDNAILRQESAGPSIYAEDTE